MGFDLVGDSSQKRFVHQVARLQVGREYDQLVEGNADLLSPRKTEKVESFFERYDPAIEQFVDGHPLPAEVVNHQCATVALHLQRRLADAAGKIGGHLESGHGQFTAGDDGGAFDPDPAFVDLAVVE